MTQEHTAGGLLSDALKLVTGDRGLQHGPKLSSFNMIADLWNTYLQGRVAAGPITAADTCIMLSLLKIARSAQGQQLRDHYLDAAAYLAIAWEVLER